jgi:hypothetical protein
MDRLARPLLQGPVVAALPIRRHSDEFRFAGCKCPADALSFGDIGDGGAGGECLGDAEETAFATEFRGGFGLCFFGDWCLAFAHACQSARGDNVCHFPQSPSSVRNLRSRPNVRDGGPSPQRSQVSRFVSSGEFGSVRAHRNLGEIAKLLRTGLHSFRRGLFDAAICMRRCNANCAVGSRPPMDQRRAYVNTARGPRRNAAAGWPGPHCRRPLLGIFDELRCTDCTTDERRNL